MLREGKTLLVVNPAAKRGHGAEAGRHVLRALRGELGVHAIDVANTYRPKHAVALAADAAGYRNVIALGGDGVIHEVVNGLMKIPEADRPAFGVVRSVNDYARSLGMPFSPDAAVSALMDAPERAVDVGCCNGEYFDETLSFGLDAGVALGTVAWRKRLHISGAPLYLASGIDQMLFHLDAYRFTLQIDADEPREGDMVMLAVQIGQTYGGGFRICPQAQLDDGLFDICYASPVKTLRAVRVFLSAKNAHHVNAPEVHFARAGHIRLSFDAPPPVQIDGEPLVAESFDIRIHHRALRVLAPGA
ncbi:MAG: diacylglycerol kinase family lipid kinase [Coriobacteriaceae bacterium]|nr:diacylglycerol kinase family lipid kinase [Coriobacteriaceae bacterium]